MAGVARRVDHPELGVEAGDLILDKSTCDTFAITNLDEELSPAGPDA